MRTRKSTDFPNCISLNGNSIPNFAASLLSWFTKSSNDFFEPLHIPMQSSMTLLKNRIASMDGMFGFACENKTQWRKMSAICDERLPSVGMPILELNVSSL